MSWCSPMCNVTGSSLHSRSVVIFRSPVLIEEVKSLDRDTMDVLPSGGIFRELQVVHDTGYFPTQGQPSLEEDWHQVRECYYTWWLASAGCSDKGRKNPTSIIMQYVKHSNWRLKYSVKWRTEILKVTIHHFTITAALSLSSMRESEMNPSEFQSRIPASKRCSYPSPFRPTDPPPPGTNRDHTSS